MEGIANHHGPESCAASSNRRSEALTGVYIGEVLSPEIIEMEVLTLSVEGESNTVRGEIIRESLTDFSGSEALSMCRSVSDGKRESPEMPQVIQPEGRSMKGQNRRWTCTSLGSRTKAYDL
jgi:hypothetical protein